jgi:hypothetical protein
LTGIPSHFYPESSGNPKKSRFCVGFVGTSPYFSTMKKDYNWKKLLLDLAKVAIGWLASILTNT